MKKETPELFVITLKALRKTGGRAFYLVLFYQLGITGAMVAMSMRNYEYGKADDDHDLNHDVDPAHGAGDGDDSDGSRKHARSSQQHWAFLA